jgi:NTE family protein
LNGWAIAGGCPAEELIAHWTDASADTIHLRLLQPPWRGIFDGRLLEKTVQRLYRAYRPRTEYGLVVVALRRLRARLFHGAGITARHLQASCAIPGGFAPVRIDGRLYCDGGLISPLPVWAAAALGARRIIAVNALPFMPSRPIRYFVGGVRRLTGSPAPPDNAEVIVLTPSSPLGSIRDAVYWKPENTARWIELGWRDAKTIRQQECFG